MRKVTKITIPAALALFVVTAHPQSEKRSDDASKPNQQQRNEQSTFDPQRVSDSELKKSVTDINKASSFTRMAVQNLQHEKLGTVNDLVFDPETGKISYAVLSVGGVLGVGDKLVAVPLTSLRPQPGQNYLVLNMTKDELKSAPGLAKNSWPKLNDPGLGGAPSSETSKSSSSSTTTSPDPSLTQPATEANERNQQRRDDSSQPNKPSDQLSSPQPESNSSTANDAQGSSPATSSGSEKGVNSGKAEGATSSSDSNSDASSSTPKP